MNLVVCSVYEVNDKKNTTNEIVKDLILYKDKSRISAICHMNEYAKKNGSSQCWNVYERSFFIGEEFLCVLKVERRK